MAEIFTIQLESILLDEGYLTDLRTAAAGALVAKYLAPDRCRRSGYPDSQSCLPTTGSDTIFVNIIWAVVKKS